MFTASAPERGPKKCVGWHRCIGTVEREIHINVTEDKGGESKNDHRIVAYNVPCKVAGTNVTLVDETDESLKIMCPYVQREDHASCFNMRCQLRDAPGGYYKELCGIYEGMKQSDHK